MHIKKHLSFDALVGSLSDRINQIVEHRREGSIDYSIHDVMMSAFACMYFQSPSLVQFQRQLELQSHRNNLKTMFNVSSTPKSTAMKEFIDEVKPSSLSPVFKDYLSRLQRNHYLSEYKSIDNKYLAAIDGTEFFNSKSIHCEQCLTKENNKTGEVIYYSHQSLQAVIVHPDKKQILPLMPEEISNTDGSEKQDCETNAAKRLLPQIHKDHPRMNFIWLADSIYANAKFIETIQEKQGDNYIFRIKQGDHKSLYNHIKTASYHSHQSIHKNGKETLHYRWYTDVPLNNSCNIKVNVIQLFSTTKDKDGNNIPNLVGVWATDIKVNKDNIEEVTKAARCRWKVENECFNTLKNLGYALEHSYGHGKKNLAFNFYVLILLAFMMHQIHELTDPLFKEARGGYNSKKAFWGTLLVLVNMIVFDKWIDLMGLARDSRSPDFKGLNYSPPD